MKILQSLWRSALVAVAVQVGVQADTCCPKRVSPGGHDTGELLFPLEFAATRETLTEIVDEDPSSMVKEFWRELAHHSLDPSIGPVDASTTLVEFIDYGCPYSRDAASHVMDFAQANPHVRIVFKPLHAQGPSSLVAAIASLAAAHNSEWASFHAALMGSAPNLTVEEAIEAAARAASLDVDELHQDMRRPVFIRGVENSQQLARTLGVAATPHYILRHESGLVVQTNSIGDKKITTVLTLDQIVRESANDEGSDVVRFSETEVRQLVRFAEQGDPTAQFTLGHMYENGRSVQEDVSEAVRWYRLAADRGVALAQLHLWSMYLDGIGVARDHVEATRWLRLAADQGVAVAQISLADMYLEGLGVGKDDTEAVRWLRRAADSTDSGAGLSFEFLGDLVGAASQFALSTIWNEGNAAARTEAQFLLGLMHMEGRGVPPVDAEAMRWFRLAADRAHAGAQNILGLMYLEGRGVAQNHTEAVRWYRLAAEQGHADGQVNLGGMYDRGWGVAQNDSEAVRWYRLAAGQGDAGGQTNLGYMYAHGRGVAKDDAEAVRWYRLAAEQGNSVAQHALGIAYAEGQGVVRDDTQAVRWYHRAAEQGHAYAQFSLGAMYDEGRGAEPNHAEAVRWYRLAAGQGDADAQTNLGYMYAKGRGVAQDDAEAVRWYRLAAEQGDAEAQTNLGYMYAEGRGVAQDDTEAVRWYGLAAGQGDADAQINLGYMYTEGRGVAQDDAEAVRWYRLAAEQGAAYAWTNLAYMYANGRGVVQDVTRAVTSILRALEIDPSDSNLHLQAGDILQKLDRPSDALEYYQEALALSPNDPWTYNHVAWELATGKEGTRNGTEAVRIAEHALRLENNAAIVDTYAAALVEAGRLREAMRAYELALSKDSDLLITYKNALNAQGYQVVMGNDVYDVTTRAALRACVLDGCQLLDAEP